jgi:predicted nucleotidyltransferase component of viral defense system
VLTYVLQLLVEGGHGDRIAFKGGTALRKLVLGPGGRFSVDLDFVALDRRKPPPEDSLFDDLATRRFHGIDLRIEEFRESGEGNFGATATYRHADAEGRFEIQLSHRHDIVIPAETRPLVPQPYFPKLEFGPSPVVSLHPFEMLAEKVLACHRRAGAGSARDVYDLYQFADRPFDSALVTSLTCLKAWADRADFSPDRFLEGINPSRYNWVALEGLVGRNRAVDRDRICQRVRERYNVLASITDLDERVLADACKHRYRGRYDQLAEEVRAGARNLGT